MVYKQQSRLRMARLLFCQIIMITTQNKTRGRGRRDAVALLLLFLTLFLLIALGSYLLPLFGPEPTRQQPIANWCGAFGFYSAHYLFSFFGLIAFLPIGLLGCALGSTLFSRTSTHRLPAIVAGISGMLFSSSGLFWAFEQLLAVRSAGLSGATSAS